MAELTKKRLAAIRARDAAATPGPWEADDWEIYGPDQSVWVGETCDSDDWNKSCANAEFIAHARTDVRDLLAEVERLRRPWWAWPVTIVVWGLFAVGWLLAAWGWR